MKLAEKAIRVEQCFELLLHEQPLDGAGACVADKARKSFGAAAMTSPSGPELVRKKLKI